MTETGVEVVEIRSTKEADLEAEVVTNPNPLPRSDLLFQVNANL